MSGEAVLPVGARGSGRAGGAGDAGDAGLGPGQARRQLGQLLCDTAGHVAGSYSEALSAAVWAVPVEVGLTQRSACNYYVVMLINAKGQLCVYILLNMEQYSVR